VLTIRRRCGESVLLGDNIEIRVLEVAGGRVKLGISAPREVLVLRNELKLTQEFNLDAARFGPSGRGLSVAMALSKYARSKTGESNVELFPKNSRGGL
jgi:carbon storage regulator